MCSASLVDNKPLRLLDAEELLSAVSGYGQKESGQNISKFDRDLPLSVEWQDMDQRIKFLEQEGFAAQVIYPTVGLLWEAAVKDSALADALCRAYNTWAFEICSSHKDRLLPAAHPHAEGFVEPVRKARERLASLPAESVNKVLCTNAREFYRIT